MAGEEIIIKKKLVGRTNKRNQQRNIYINMQLCTILLLHQPLSSTPIIDLEPVSS
jgi:hypothetical protein